MELKTKYSIGDTVMVAVNRIHKITCPFCNGVGYKEVGPDDDKSKYYCQNCEGDGNIASRSDKFVAAPGKIIGMFYRITNDISEYDDEDDYAKIEDGYGHEIEYYIKVDDDKYWGGGTYNESKIRPLGEVAEGTEY